MTGPPTWNELLFLMVHGPDRPMRGRIREVEPPAERFFGWAGSPDDPPPAVVTAAQGVVDVWRSGSRVRVEEPDGRLRLVCDGVTAWVFGEGEVPDESPVRNVAFAAAGTSLLVRSDAERWVGDDFTVPTGEIVATTFLGRPCWEVELAPPAHKPYPMQLVVDAETGMELQQRNDQAGLLIEWTSLTMGEDVDPDLFRWTGLVRTWEERREQARRARLEQEELRAGWALEHLGTRTLSITIDVQIEIHDVESDGSLVAYIDEVGSLFRRPLSDSAWSDVEPVEGSGRDVRRWSEGRWDWALQPRSPGFTEQSLTELQAQLRGAGAQDGERGEPG